MYRNDGEWREQYREPEFPQEVLAAGDADRDEALKAGHGALNSTNQILASLPNSLLRSLLPAMKRIDLEQESYLFQPDDEPDFIYFPETAAVSEFQILEDGRMVEVAIIGREGAIGLSKLFCYTPIPNCVQITQAGTAIRVSIREARRIVREKPEAAFYFYPYVDTYIRQISQKTICNLYHSVKARFCTWLLMVQDRCDNTVLHLTHEQIARTLGVYRPRITCIAREMKRKKIINYSRGGISICNRSEIEHAACNCYAEIAEYIDHTGHGEARLALN